MARLTQVRFLQVVDVLRTIQEKLRSERTTVDMVLKEVAQRTDFVVTPAHIKSALKALHIKLKKPRNHIGVTKMNNVKYAQRAVLANSIVDLYTKLGETVPADLIAFTEKLNSKIIKENDDDK